MKIRSVILMLSVAAAALLPMAALASDNGTADATIVTAIGVTQNTNAGLNFGTWVPGTATVVTVDDTGSVSQDSGSATQVNTTLNPSHSATFTVTGTKDLAYTITVPPGSISITSGSGGSAPSMTVDTFESGKLTGLIGSNGKDQFTVGAKLYLNSGQAVGVYTGTFNVIVAYN